MILCLVDGEDKSVICLSSLSGSVDIDELFSLLQYLKVHILCFIL